jgi:hypothetical protein
MADPVEGYNSGVTKTSQVTLLSGEDQTNNVMVQYHVIPASTTDTCGTTGAAGDLLHSFLATWTSSTGTVTIKDNATTIFQMVGGRMQYWNGSAGVTYSSGATHVQLTLDCVCLTNWTITCGANCTALAVGRFT